MENAEVKKKKWTSVYSGNGYISVSASSGYRNCAGDHEAYHLVMKDDCSDEELGESVRTSLMKSRFLPVDEVREFMKPERVQQRYEVFVDALLKEMGGIERNKAFRKMKQCHVRFEDGKVEIKPSQKARGEAWEVTSFTNSHIQHTDLKASNSEIGATVREALKFCK